MAPFYTFIIKNFLEKKFQVDVNRKIKVSYAIDVPKSMQTLK